LAFPCSVSTSPGRSVCIEPYAASSCHEIDMESEPGAKGKGACVASYLARRDDRSCERARAL
jgi:hypothetical protein